MKRAVLSTGFGIGRSTAERAGEALGQYYGDVDVFTFSETMRLTEEDSLRRIVDGVSFWTHSAAKLALPGTRPAEVHALSAPLPTSVPHLIAKTVSKTGLMHIPGRSIAPLEDMRSVYEYDKSSLVELTSKPWDNLKHLSRIATFNAISVAKQAREAGIEARLAYGDKDLYFTYDEYHRAHAEIADVPVYEFNGQHDEPVLRPEKFLAEYLNGSNV